MLQRLKKQKIFTKNSIRFKAALTVMVFACLLVFTSCTTKEEEPTDILNGAVGQYSASLLPAPDASGVVGKKPLLTISAPKTYNSLHPLSSKEDAVADLLSLVAEPGLQLSANGELEPCLIKEWALDDAGLVYTFTLRDKIFFHNGEKLTADDAVATIKTIMKADIATCSYVRYIDAVVSVEKTDELSFIVTATRKTSEILYLMTAPIVPSSVYDSLTLKTKKAPVGTGPYVVEDISEDGVFTFVENENWWKGDLVYERIVARPVDNAEVVMGANLMEQLDVLSTMQIAAGTYNATGRYSVQTLVTPYMDCLVPKITGRYLSDASIRQAISFAINRGGIVSTALNGLGEPTAVPLRPDYYALESEAYQVVYDIAKANVLLDVAGYSWGETDAGKKMRYKETSDGSKNFIRIKLLYTDGTGTEYRGNAAGLIKADLEKIGIELVLEKADATTYLERLEKRDFELVFCNFYMYRNNDMQFLLEAPYNYGSFGISNIKSQLNACDAAVTEAELKEAYHNLYIALQEHMPIIGLYYKECAVVTKKEVVPPSAKLAFKNLYADMHLWQ